MSIARSAFFVPAILFLGLAVGFGFGPDGVRWLWKDEPWVAVVLFALSSSMWLLPFVRLRRRRVP